MLSWEVDERGVGVLTLDQPESEVILLTETLMEALGERLEALSHEQGLRAVLVQSAKEEQFVAGASLDEIRAIRTPQEGYEKAKRGQAVLHRLARLPVPTIAVINGPCLGGGTELALACNHRVAADDESVRIGLPEVRLGIIPGFGGTQRLPRLLGIGKALRLILSGNPVSSGQALQLGLVDAIYPTGELSEQGKAFALECALARRSTRGRRSFFSRALESIPYTRGWLFSQARRSVMKRTFGCYPAPLAAIRAIQEGLELSLEDGLELEARLVGELLVSSEARNLIRLFFLQREARQAMERGATRALRDLGIVGSGVMGAGIAQLATYKQIRVLLNDIDESQLELARQRIEAIFQEGVRRGKIGDKEARERMGLVSFTKRLSDLRDAQLVIEAVVEDEQIKQEVFRKLERELPEATLLASNTSSLSISQMSRRLGRPERFIGLHFFHPVHRMALVEIVRGEASSDEAVFQGVRAALALGKTPIVVRDGPGFLVNRLLFGYLSEGILLVEEGLEISAIDRVMRAFGMAMGPLELVDMVGIDVATRVARIVAEAFRSRLQQPLLLQRLFEKGWHGKKSGQGFYRYRGKRRKANKGIRALIGSRSHRAAEDALLQKRLLFPMISEAARCLEEEIAQTPSDIDLAMVLGTGFAPFRGGPCRFADEQGLQTIIDGLRQLSRENARFQPAPSLERLLKEQGTFYPHEEP